MKKHRLFASVLSVLLAASAAMTCYASTENYNDGAAHTVEGNVENTDSSMTAVSAEGDGTSVTVNGSVESAGAGVSASAGGSATVGESVKADTMGASASGNSSVSVGGDVEATITGVTVSDNSTASVGGSISTETIGGVALNVSGGSSANVTGNVISGGDGLILASDHSTVEVGGYAQGHMGVDASDNSSISIGGSVNSAGSVNAGGNSTITVGGDVNYTGNYSAMKSVNATDGSTVNITGSVNAPQALGINAGSGSTVTVGNDVKTDGKAVEASGGSTVTIGGNVEEANGSADNAVSVFDGSSVTISGNVTFDNTVGIHSRDKSTVTVSGNVTGDAEMGALYSESGGVIIVEGNVTDTTGPAVALHDDSKVTVKGDASGEGEGIRISVSGNSGSGSSNSSSNGAVVVLGTVTADAGSDSYCINVTGDALTQEEVMQALPTIIVGELSSANEQFVNYTNHSNNNELDTEAVAQAIAEQILYYIEVQDTENGSIKIDSGTSKVEGYDVAHANDTVTVTVTADQGYEIQTVNGGKATAVKNTDGSWSITVPKTGGVSISAIMAAIKQVEDETNSGGGSGDGNDAGSSVYYTPSSVYYIGDGGGTWQYVDSYQNPKDNPNAYYDYNEDEYQSEADVAGIWEYIENQGYYQIDEVEGSGDYLTSIDLGNSGNSGKAGNANKAGRTGWKWQEKNSDKNGTVEKAGWKKLRWGDYLDWYFFDNDRLMRAGFINWKGNRYFLNPISNGYRGRMLTGYQKINGLEYYFEEKEGPLQGRMYRNENVPDKRFAGPDGVIR